MYRLIMSNMDNGEEMIWYPTPEEALELFEIISAKVKVGTRAQLKSHTSTLPEGPSITRTYDKE